RPRARPARLGLGDGDRAGQGAAGAVGAEVVGGREAPRALDPHAHAEPRALVAVDAIDRAVADGDHLGQAVDVARLGVVAGRRDDAYEVRQEVKHQWSRPQGPSPPGGRSARLAASSVGARAPPWHPPCVLASHADRLTRTTNVLTDGTTRTRQRRARVSRPRPPAAG